MKIYSLKFKILGFMFLIISLLVSAIIINNIVKLNAYIETDVNEQINQVNDRLHKRYNSTGSRCI